MSIATTNRPLIFVVDDDPDIREYFRKVLEQAGYEVTAFTDAVEAIVALERRQPAAIVLDIAMPGVDGVHFAEDLCRDDEWRRIPIIVVTALKSFGGGDHLLMETENIRRVMFKPFPAETLVSGVHDVLRWHG